MYIAWVLPRFAARQYHLGTGPTPAQRSVASKDRNSAPQVGAFQSNSLRRLVRVLADPSPLLVANPKVELRIGIVLLGSFMVPSHRLGVILCNASSIGEAGRCPHKKWSKIKQILVKYEHRALPIGSRRDQGPKEDEMISFGRICIRSTYQPLRP